jgi:hypothetical protein
VAALDLFDADWQRQATAAAALIPLAADPRVAASSVAVRAGSPVAHAGLCQPRGEQRRVIAVAGGEEEWESSYASSAELNPRWVRVVAVEHGHQRSPTVANAPEEPQVAALPTQAAGMRVGDSDCGREGRRPSPRYQSYYRPASGRLAAACAGGPRPLIRP